MVEHTGDVAVRLRAADLAGLIRSGVDALRSLLFEGEAPPDAARETQTVEVSGIDREDVLIQALSEALYLLQSRGLCPQHVEVEVGAGLRAQIRLDGARADGRQLRVVDEIKAVTYHAVRIEEQDGMLETLVVLDV